MKLAKLKAGVAVFGFCAAWNFAVPQPVRAPEAVREGFMAFAPARAAAYEWFREKLSTPVATTVATTLEAVAGTPQPAAADEPELSKNQPVVAPVEPLRSPAGVKKEDLHLYLLVGQSNMAGRGEISDEDRKAHPRVFSLGKENQWVPATEPLHWDIRNRGIGPGLTFGKKMAEANPNVAIGLIPAAVGGTLVSYWLPGAERALFENAVRQARRAQTTGTIKGILWQQGESDSYGDRPSFYRERLLTVLRGFRRELGDENIPIIIGGLGDFLKPPKAKDVNEALQVVAGEIGNAAFVPASKKGHIGDQLHFNGAAARENGEFMAAAMLSLRAKR